MVRKRKRNLTPRQNPQQSRPAVPEVLAEPNPSPTDTPTSSPTPTPPPTPRQKSIPERQEPKKTTPTLFTETERDELFTMTERDATTVARARMSEVFPDEENIDIKEQLAAAEALYSRNQRSRLADNGKILSEAVRPQRGRPHLDTPVRPRRGRPTAR